MPRGKKKDQEVAAIAAEPKSADEEPKTRGRKRKGAGGDAPAAAPAAPATAAAAKKDEAEKLGPANAAAAQAETGADEQPGPVAVPSDDADKKPAAKKAKPAAKKAPKKAAKADDEDADDGEEEGAAAMAVNVLPTNFKEPSKQPNELKIVSWNVAGFNAILGKGFVDYVKNENPDVICIQETKIAPSAKLEQLLPGYHGHFLGATQKGYSGVAVYCKEKPIAWVDGIGYPECDDEGRAITIEYADFYLLNTYIPNAGRKLATLPKRLEWDERFIAYVKGLEAKKPVIWCGDLNVAHAEIDLANPQANKRNAGFTLEERNNFTRFLNLGFVDSFRHFHPDEASAYTFWSFLRNARQKNIGWRLDYFVVSKTLMPRVSCSYRRPNVMGSDHCPIVIHFKKEA